MGLADDAKPKFWGGYLVEGLHPMIFGPKENVPAVWTPEYCAMSECSRRMAQMIGRARAETKAAKDAVIDHASRHFVLQQINRILEALQ